MQHPLDIFYVVLYVRSMDITPEQCRAARAWLQWSQSDLARRAEVSTPTIARFEIGASEMGKKNREAIARALAHGGVSPFGSPSGIGIVTNTSGGA